MLRSNSEKSGERVRKSIISFSQTTKQKQKAVQNFLLLLWDGYARSYNYMDSVITFFISDHEKIIFILFYNMSQLFLFIKKKSKWYKQQLSQLKKLRTLLQRENFFRFKGDINSQLLIVIHPSSIRDS